jgi:hypothetical protein
MTPTQFVNSLQGATFDNVFNPYTDRCEVHDLDDAPDRRAKALLKMLKAAAQTEIDALWIGRDLGYRGGRRTGLALTDDIHLSLHATRWKIKVDRATTGTMVGERTAAVIWSMLASVPTHVFLWNVFPFHPHEPGDPFTNRSHTSKERKAGEAILADLILMLQPRRLICIGNDATKTAVRLAGTADVVQVRHPSYGGQNEFIRQIECLYGVRAQRKQLSFTADAQGTRLPAAVYF